jgi:hypothetical protein
MTRIAALLALPFALPLTLTLAGCSAAQDAVSDATASAQQAAEQKAKDLAMQAFRSQVCSLTADGRLSAGDQSKLRAGLDAAAAAGVPAQVVDTIRPLVDRSGTATAAQVQRVHQQVCTG